MQILIGIDVPEAHCPLKVLRGARKEPYALKSILGWTIHGPLGRVSSNMASFHYIQTSTQHPDDALDEDIQRMFRMDFTDHDMRSPDLSIEDRYAVKIIKDSTIHLPDSHYQVALPFKPNGEKVLDSHTAESYQGSLGRLKWLKKRFQKDPELFRKYTAKIRKLQGIGFSRTIESSDKRSGWFLPHFPAFHPQKPDDVRVVKDGAACFGGTSLNDQLLQGPDINNTLVGVLTRFREGKIAVVADVEGMFHQVRVAPQHTKYLRFLWFQNDVVNGPVEEREKLVHPFGARPSPTVSNFTLRKTAEDNKEDYSAQVVKAVKDNFYVDDMASSKDTVKEGIELVTDLPDMLKKGGFRLTKFISNSPEVMAAVPPEDRASSVKGLDFNDYSSSTCVSGFPVERTLGVHWDVETDQFKCRVVSPCETPTKRNILKVVARTFDPLGIFSPFLLHARQIFQELCRQKSAWDQTFDRDLMTDG